MPAERALHGFYAAPQAEHIAAEAQHAAARLGSAIGIGGRWCHGPPVLAMLLARGLHAADRFPEFFIVPLAQDAELLREVAGTDEQQIDPFDGGNLVDFLERSERFDLNRHQMIAV